MRRTIYPSILLIALTFSMACTGGTPSAAIKGFYKAVAEGNSESAIEFLSQKTIAMVGQEKLKAGIQEATRKTLKNGGITEVEITKESTVGEVSAISVILKYGNGEQEVENLDLVKEKGGWKIEPKK
jgi:Domain of unknown function (DUF4878)